LLSPSEILLVVKRGVNRLALVVEQWLLLLKSLVKSLLRGEGVVLVPSGLRREGALVGKSLRGEGALRGESLVKSLLSGEVALVPSGLLRGEALLSNKSLLASESLLRIEVLLDAKVLDDRRSALVDDLVGVDGGLGDVLSQVLLGALDDGDDPLAVNDGLDLIHDLSVDILLNDRLVLEDALLRRSGLGDVLLDVMHDIVVHGAVQNGLHLHYAVLADCLLDDGSSDVGYGSIGDCCAVGEGALLKEGVLLESSARVEGVLLLAHVKRLSRVERGLVESSSWLSNEGGLLETRAIVEGALLKSSACVKTGGLGVGSVLVALEV